jgi:hypothetical protein
MSTTSNSAKKNTTAFYAQAALSFGVSMVAVIIGILYLPVEPWVRAFLALGALYLVTSSFTLAKCIRDQQDDTSVISRLDQARLERLLAEFDPYRNPPNLLPIANQIAVQNPGPVGPAPSSQMPSHQMPSNPDPYAPIGTNPQR